MSLFLWCLWSRFCYDFCYRRWLVNFRWQFFIIWHKSFIGIHGFKLAAGSYCVFNKLIIVLQNGKILYYRRLL